MSNRRELCRERKETYQHRISRFSKFASLATRVAGNVIAEGTKQIAKGNRPKAKDLLLTPQNIARLTDQLAHLRGAAMKLGQMLSMDAGDILEPGWPRFWPDYVRMPIQCHQSSSTA